MSVDLDFITTRPMPFKALDKKADYISRWDAIIAVQEHFTEDGFCGYKDGQKMLDRINAIPSADVQEIRRGKWMYDDDTNTGIYAICSCCKESIYQAFEFYYCPNCGARIEEDDG